MINKSNDLPSFVNETNLPKIVDKLTDASNIKIANNKYGNRVQTVIDKIVEKADDITKAIKQEVVNDNYSFKVGTGDVNVSTDVEDGFGEVGVKGVTYQNLLGTLVTVGKEWVESDNKYTLNLPSGSGQPQIRYNLAYPLKPNAKYTLICEIKEYTTGYPHFCFMTKDNTTLASTTEFVPNSVGIKTAILTTKSDVNAELLRILPRNNTDNIYSIGKNIILLEGDHTNNPNLPSYFEGIVGVGDKSKNLFNGNAPFNSTLHSVELKDSLDIIYDSNKDLIVTKGINGYRHSKSQIYSLKANTKYTISGKAIGIGHRLVIKDSTGGEISKDIDANTEFFHTFTTINGDIRISFLLTGVTHTNYPNFEYGIKNFQLEEGTVATEHQICGTHKIEILSHGKNLYKPNLQTKSANGLTFSLHGNTLIVNGTCTRFVDFRPITTTLELYTYVNNLPIGTTLNLSNNLGLKNYFGLKRNGVQTYLANTLIIQEGDYDISCFVRFEEGQSYNNAELKIQLEINNVATEFEPYIEDKTQILLDEPLMRLPNGVCDEITRDGKLIRRVGKIVFDGSEDWRKYSLNTNEYNTTNKTSVFYVQINDKSVGYNTSICDRFANTKNNDAFAMSAVRNGLYSDHINLPNLYFDYGENNSYSVTNFKQWLSQNPTTVYYELATPIITQLPAPYLRIFKDGHLTFNTLVSPESSHMVQLNKSAQIERSIREVQGLDNRINVLENNYDNLMLSTISRLNDLELNYTLK